MNKTLFISLIASCFFESTIAATFSNNFDSGILDVSDFRNLSENDSGTWYSTASDPSFGSSTSYFNLMRFHSEEDQMIIIYSEGKKECKGANKLSKSMNDNWEFWETYQANCDD